MALDRRVRAFAEARDWQEFHTPKNLMLALASEVGEAADVLRWLTDAQLADLMAGDHNQQLLADELADILIFLVRLSDICNVNLLAAAHAKVDKNERRYPVELARGNARKHSGLAGQRGATEKGSESE